MNDDLLNKILLDKKSGDEKAPDENDLNDMLKNLGPEQLNMLAQVSKSNKINKF